MMTDKSVSVPTESRPTTFHDRLADTLCNVAQLLDGWHADGTAWSEWDESVRQQVSQFQGEVELIRKRNIPEAASSSLLANDSVIAETHVLVPREIESWLIDLRELAATAFRENGHSHAGMGELLGCQDCADVQSAGIRLTNTMRDWLPKLLADSTPTQEEALMKFSTWLRQQLETAGMSAGELAERARVARSGLYHYLDDKRVPDRKAIERLAIALGIDMAMVPERFLSKSEAKS